jgi:hypothetical protein
VPDFRRGAQAIEESASRKGSGSFRPFVPVVQWRDDREQKYVQFLTPISETITCDVHEWIPVGMGEKSDGDSYTKYEQFISRKDSSIGEDHDDLEDRLEIKPKERTMGVAVELEAVTETDDKGRERVTGFVVATDTYTRKDDDGNEEEVTQPLIGIVSQSAQNFFGWLSSYDASQGPIEETPMLVTRRGRDASTTYDFIPMENRAVNFESLLDDIAGVSYLRDHLDDLLEELSRQPDDAVAAQTIAAALLDIRLKELCDKERYDELVGPIESIETKYGKKKTNVKRERPKRPSRREANGDVPDAEPEAKETKAAPGSRTDRFAKLRAQVETKQSK